MKPNAQRMQTVVDFVAANPGATTKSCVYYLLEAMGVPHDNVKPGKFKQAQATVERVIKDRHVRQDPAQRLHPWDPARKAFAEALERAVFAAPTRPKKLVLLELAVEAWKDAGDENAAKILERLVLDVSGPS